MNSSQLPIDYKGQIYPGITRLNEYTGRPISLNIPSATYSDFDGLPVPDYDERGNGLIPIRFGFWDVVLHPDYVHTFTAGKYVFAYHACFGDLLIIWQK